jgi:hypothetical protein
MISIRSRVFDVLGACASGLCLIHCIATPFLFVAQTGLHQYLSDHKAAPVWWVYIDILALVISLIAIYFSAKSATDTWFKVILYASWLLLAFIILNEKLELLKIAEFMIYFPSIALVTLHLLNLKKRF